MSTQNCCNESPMKPESAAVEPAENAKFVPSPASSFYDADQSDSCFEERNCEDSMVPTTAVVTEHMIEEENKLQQQAEIEEQKQKEKRDEEWAHLKHQEKTERFERLKQLLQRSNLYTEYLIGRMKRQEEEEAQRQERRAKKQARQEEKRNEEQNFASGEMVSSSTQKAKEKEEGHNLRRKRKAEEDCVNGEKIKLSKKLAVKDMQCAADEKSMNRLDEMNRAKHSDPATLKQESASTAVIQQQRNHNGEPIPVDQPQLMTGGILRPYQLEGYLWLKTLYENGVNGILADEMGLGKTVQCIAMLSHLIYMGVTGPFLICAPLSTVPNWYNEFQQFAPQVPVMLYHGTKEERAELRSKINPFHHIREGVEVRTIIITSYEVAMMDQKYLQRHDWRYLVVDEGHRIKNSHCRLISALRMYKTTNRLLLTGTPLQNNLAELWSLLNFLLPEIFDDLGSFEAWFDIEHIGDEMVADKQKKDVLSMLHQILTPFLLRRLKTDVDMCIPPKKEVIVYAPLRPLQKEFYAALIDKTIFAKIQEKSGAFEKEKLDSRGRPLRKVSQNKVDYSLMMGTDKDEKECRTSRQKAREEEEIEGWVNAVVEMQQKRKVKAIPQQKVSQLTIKLRNVMMQLRKCCSHPFLLEHPLDKNTGELSLDERIISESGKMLILDRMLRELHRRGHKVLIFSQMTRMLDLLEDFCALRKYGYCRLDGAMNIQDRRENMVEYQRAGSDKFVFLLSTRAGGLGINLTAADTVIIYDSDWNPQCDLQAQDRCHRIGQTRPVMVYRLVTANTIDQRIVERAAAKRKLEKLVIHQGKFKSGMKNFKTSLEPISSEELLELLSSKDHESEVGSSDGQELISDVVLEDLLDRSDLEQKWKVTQEKVNSDTTNKEDNADMSLRSQIPLCPALPRIQCKQKPRKERFSRKEHPASATTISSTLFKVIDIDDGRSFYSAL